MHKDCVSLRIVDIFYEALSWNVDNYSTVTSRNPHHVLGNLWIKIAGWFKRNGLPKHKQSGWQIWWIGCGLLFVLGQLRGLAVLSSEQHLEVITKLKCRTSRDWCQSHCLEWLARYLVHVAVVFAQPVRYLLWEPLLLVKADGVRCRSG